MTALVRAHAGRSRPARLDAPVAHYWPEFAAGGKAAIPVRHLLSHTAGLAALTPRLPTEALYDWTRMTDALAAESAVVGAGHAERLPRA